MSEPTRTFLHDADDLWCPACRAWRKMLVYADERTVKRLPGGYISESDPPNPDPPLLPTMWQCQECRREYDSKPTHRRDG